MGPKFFEIPSSDLPPLGQYFRSCIDLEQHWDGIPDVHVLHAHDHITRVVHERAKERHDIG